MMETPFVLRSLAVMDTLVSTYQGDALSQC